MKKKVIAYCLGVLLILLSGCSNKISDSSSKLSSVSSSTSSSSIYYIPLTLEQIGSERRNGRLSDINQHFLKVEGEVTYILKTVNSVKGFIQSGKDGLMFSVTSGMENIDLIKEGVNIKLSGFLYKNENTMTDYTLQIHTADSNTPGKIELSSNTFSYEKISKFKTNAELLDYYGSYGEISLKVSSKESTANADNCVNAISTDSSSSLLLQIKMYSSTTSAKFNALSANDTFVFYSPIYGIENDNVLTLLADSDTNFIC